VTDLTENTGRGAQEVEGAPKIGPHRQAVHIWNAEVPEESPGMIHKGRWKMAIRLEKSGELMMIRGIREELDDQKEWNNKRSKLGVLVVAILAVTAVVFIGPHVPGYAIVSNAFKSFVAAIW
jgi:hypothetical protein